ncbi:MAG: sulfatase-like hydrolase/transferase, partial [Thermoanaerobaculales bacterium]|nr:sulfatase-like hydrolase/transferase [Thermoanaerobaculales bacterium]
MSPLRSSTRRRYRARAMLVIALVAVGGLSCAPGRPRDVVLITVDTLRADRIGAYGCADCSTPEIDRLAADGVRFASALTPLPRTTPAVASLLTGLEPHH